MKTIYLVEDDLYVSRMYERAFRFNGYEVQVMHNGEEALGYLIPTKEIPAAILLDIMVPHLDSRDFLREVKKDERLKNIPVVVLTNSFRKEDEKQFLDLGADLYMVKIEHQVKDVVERVKELINRSK